jgi:D-alanyl-D-alanine carboxypeptidase
MVFWIVLAILVVVTAAAIFLAVQVNDRKSELTEAILANPNTSAVAAYTFDNEGELVEDGKALFIGADTPLVMASTMKIVVLAAYEYAVTQNKLGPAEEVRISELEKYYLPMTDGGAHIQGLGSLGIKTDSLGFAQDQTRTISLDDIARIMIHYSGNAETDYLIERLGTERIDSIAGFDHQTLIRPTLGVALALMNHEGTLSDESKRGSLVHDVSEGDFRSMERLIDLYTQDPQWRNAQIEFMRSGEYIRAATEIGWKGQVEASALFPKGTAREYARLMAKIASQQFISPEVSTLAQEKLESVPSEWPLRLLYFQRYGSKNGLTAGVMNLASYGFPKFGPLAGKGRVVVILTNDLTYETWSKQVPYEGVYLLQIDLARAGKFFDKLAASR